MDKKRPPGDMRPPINKKRPPIDKKRPSADTKRQEAVVGQEKVTRKQEGTQEQEEATIRQEEATVRQDEATDRPSATHLERGALAVVLDEARLVEDGGRRVDQVDAALDELLVVGEVAGGAPVELGRLEHAHVEVGVVEPLDRLADVPTAQRESLSMRT